MNKKKIAILGFFIGLFLFVGSAKADWWNSTFQNKRLINVTNPQANYQIPLNLTYNTHYKNSDCSDIRFTNSSENEEYSYWIEKYTANWCYVWVNMNQSGNFYLYYNNATPVSSQSNITTTFIYGNDGTIDDFQDDLIGACSASIENGWVKTVAGNDWYACGKQIGGYTTGTYELRYAINVSVVGTIGGALCFGDTTLGATSYNNNQNLFGSGNTWSLWDGSTQSFGWFGANVIFNVKILANTSLMSSTNGFDTTITHSNGTSYTYNNAGYRGTMNDLGYLMTDQYGSTMYLDDIRLRKVVSPEPTSSIGEEITCECTDWAAGDCYNTTHRIYTRICTPPACEEELKYEYDETCIPTPICFIPCSLKNNELRCYGVCDETIYIIQSIPNQNYCLDNQTLMHNITYITDDVTKNFQFSEYCHYGCDNETLECNPSPSSQILIWLGLGIGIIIFFVGILKGLRII